MKKFFVSFITVLCVLPGSAFAQLASADNPGLATGTFESIIANVTGYLAGLLSPLAILFIVLAGILFVVSGGSEERIGGAKRMLTYAVIGLVVALLAWVIVTTVGSTLDAGS